MAPLTWLHLSDLHACQPRFGWDSARVTETLVKDLKTLQRDHGLRPDLVFFTGDAAFGHLPEKSLSDQFKEAAAFLDAVRQAFDPEIPITDLFLVPGNHDVDRRQFSEPLAEWLDGRKSLDPVLKLIHEGGGDWQRFMARLASYQDFLRDQGLLHLLDQERAIYATVRQVGSLRVGIAGFNSAWTCGRDGEKGRLWAAGKWQQGVLRERLKEADFSIALIHHPAGWLNEFEDRDFRDDLHHEFRFLLHGHEHKPGVTSDPHIRFTTISAGACYERSDRENGYNLVRLDPETGEGQVWLRRFDGTGGAWGPRHMAGQTEESGSGIRHLRLDWLRSDRPQSSLPLHPAPPPPEPTRPDPDLARYLERLRAAHRDLPIAGFATRVRLPIRLETVYIPLRARIHHHAMESEHKKPGAFRELALEIEQDQDTPFDEALRLAQHHGFRGAVVLGDPGSGKTTLLKHFVLAASTDPSLLRLEPGTVPVLIELRRLKNPTAGLLSSLVESVDRTDPSLDAAAFARNLLRRDHLLILVDGLDEIADPGQRAAVSSWLEEAVKNLPHSLFVVTSRFAGYKGDSRLSGRFLELHVRDLAEKEARRFIREWYGAVEEQAVVGRPAEESKKEAAEAAGSLEEKLFDATDQRTERLRELATNPLMLQILCLVHRDRKHLPERRVDLYWDCTLVLLQLWREAKGMPMELTATQALKLLQPLAHWLHRRERKEATCEEILPLLAGPLRELGRSPDEGQALLDAIRDQSGILVSLGESYSFLHLSFQEYLTARHIQDQVLRDSMLLVELAGHFGKTWWREVILLTLGLDNPNLFELLLTAFLNTEVLGHDVRLADDCLLDSAARTPRPFLQSLAQGRASAEARYHTLRLLRSLTGWETETLPDGTTGRHLIESLLRDPDSRVQGMAAELAGIKAVPTGRRQRARSPEPGEERVNEVDGTVLLYVPGGEYTLGADDISEEEKPVHQVRLSPFWIAKYPVTNAQYGLFLEANPRTAKPRLWTDKQFNQPQQPVVGVSWEEAQAYCAWAGLRLPSEAQWEAAARGTDGRPFPWGNDEPTPEHANCGGREGHTTPVGSFPQGVGPFGTLDQAGNVWEWCEDVWNAEAYRQREGAEDPINVTGEAAVRSLRGGSWSNSAGLLAAAFRGWSGASDRSGFFGFRCLLPARPEP